MLLALCAAWSAVCELPDNTQLPSATMTTRQRASSSLLRLSYRGSNTAKAARATRAARFLATLPAGGRCWRDASAAPLCCFPHYPLASRAFSARSSDGSSSTGDADKTAASDANVGTAPEIAKDQWGNSGKLIYEGSIAHQVRRLKRVSITTCFISFLAVPALVVFGKESVPMAGQVAVMGTALAGTGGSTLLLNLCVSPYVFRMAEILEQGERAVDGDSPVKKRRGGTNRYGMRKPSGRRFRAERMNILGMRKTTEFSLDEVEPMPTTSRPFVSFKAGDHYYFIQGHDMADKALLQTLLGRELKEHEKEPLDR